ncbi:MAG TPA: sigma-54-dependent Fis family transcriptional regulator, partial [Bacteroidetes bacterium]|nr:sigma-54-dependent Fis family transcriptional regulator [Bacteroidota bacterium]
EKPIDVRVVAATNKNLKEEIRTGRFREDLYYRLGVLEIRVPPLRERAEDISLLTHHFITEKSRKLGKKIRGIHPEACRILEKYSWPGNIRELENEVERFVTLAEEDQTIGVEHLSNHLEDDISDAFLAEQPFAGTLRETVDRLERMIIEKALEEAEGNKSRVARTLGLSRLGLQKKMDRLGIIYPKNTHVTQS